MSSSRTVIGAGSSDDDIKAIASVFDEDFYRQQNPELDFKDVAPVVHFAETGWREGRDPAPWFSVRNYLAIHPDVARSGLNPLLHYLQAGDDAPDGRRTENDVPTSLGRGTGEPRVESSLDTDPDFLKSESELELIKADFDEDYYRQRNPEVDFSDMEPVLHFARIGWSEGRDPTPWFSIQGYASLHSDIRLSGINPFVHYLRHGRGEDREVIDPEAYALKLSSLAASQGALGSSSVDPDLLLVQDEFDEEFYRAENPDIDFSGTSPAQHFTQSGWREGRDPASWFSVDGYVARHEDIRRTDMNPFAHYLRFGRKEDREIVDSQAFAATAGSRETRSARLRPAQGVAARTVSSKSDPELDLMAEEFDEAYYRAKNPELRFGTVAPLAHFAKVGWREGRDPTSWFSVDGYRELHADIQRAEMNPFLHYLEFGRDERRETVDPETFATLARREGPTDPVRRPLRTAPIEPSILRTSDPDVQLMRPEFDEAFYRAQNPDVDFSAIAPIDHFAKVGWREGRDPTPWFVVDAYAALHADVRQSDANPFVHYLRFGKRENRAIIDRSVIAVDPPATISRFSRDDLILLETAIDADFYKSQAPRVDFTKISPAEHYAVAGWRAGLDPRPDFSTNGYLSLNEDVKRAKVNPFLHYLWEGRGEGRTSRRPELGGRRADGTAEWADYAYLHQRAGRDLEGASPDPEAVDFVVSLLGADLGQAVSDLRFVRDDCDEDDVLVSIVIPCVNQELVTAECLQSIAQALPTDFGLEVIVADNGSSDDLYAAIADHPQIRHVRFHENIGFGPVCNAAAEVARGEFLFLLNNDAQVAPGCLEALVEVLREPRTGTGVGIVGPKLLSLDGHLQEAGCAINRDGTGSLIGFGRDPRTPRYNYRREVEHVSGAAMLMRRDLFTSLGGFDPIYAPAYCEDADLSLKVREKGLKIVYEPGGSVAHHLSKTVQGMAKSSAHQTKLRRIAGNRQTLVTRWADTLAKTDLRTIAFYLPQFHPFPQNDLWWGKGFTEWANLAKTRPNYSGHNQPRFPADLGYYDLRVPDVMEQQAALARRYGITGFCYYYYYFDGTRLLETPLERMLETGKPDLPFCLCWANENWTRRWDGRDDDILMGQSYSDEDTVAMADDIARYFRSDAYIRVDGKPLFLVYRIKELPNPKRITGAWRNRCRANGVGEICIAMVESFELSARPEDPTLYGCDITVEFPAHGMVHDPPMAVQRLNFDWTGNVHDYRELALAFMRRVEAGFPRLRSVLVGWDTTPRHQDRSLVLEHATPGAFQAWLEWTYRRTMEQNFGDTRIVFINAWNEWGEGSYLEPDRRFGHGYLQAVRNALETVETGGDAFDI